MRNFNQSLSVALQRANARAILRRSIPHAVPPAYTSAQAILAGAVAAQANYVNTAADAAADGVLFGGQ